MFKFVQSLIDHKLHKQLVQMGVTQRKEQRWRWGLISGNLKKKKGLGNV